MKTVGAAFIIFTGFLTGFFRVYALRCEINRLADLINWITCLQNELALRNTPLPDIVQKSSTTFGGAVPDLSPLLRQGVSLYQAAGPWLQKQRPQTADIMGELFRAAGRYDSLTQSAACARASVQLEQLRKDLQVRLQEKGTVYRSVPLVVSLLLVLALI